LIICEPEVEHFKARRHLHFKYTFTTARPLTSLARIRMAMPPDTFPQDLLPRARRGVPHGVAGGEIPQMACKHNKEVITMDANEVPDFEDSWTVGTGKGQSNQNSSAFLELDPLRGGNV